jgi:Dyp-type peroxidase family
VSAYAHLECAAYRLLRIENPVAARAWLGSALPQVTKSDKKQDVWSFNVALNCEGLRVLSLNDEALATFPPAFLDGMTSERRTRILGDAGQSDPSRWRWGGPSNPVHLLLLIYAEDEAELKRQLGRWLPGPRDGLREIETLTAGRQPDSREHFGFADGVGQPVVQGSGRYDRQKERTGHATRLRAGEFVLGYPNAYGESSLSPTVLAAGDPDDLLPHAVEGSARHDVGLNGSYLVFRQLMQDVPGFWKYINAAAGVLWPGDRRGPTRLASKFVGRWPSGAPLVLHPDRDPHGGTPQNQPENNFAYAAGDPDGHACPYGAHIRRSNPRDALGPTPKQAAESANRHRLLRRGRLYGDRIKDPLQDDGVERGLHFICLNADIERQFEFVQQTWINNPVFGGLYSETDPLIGDQRPPSGMFTIQADPVRLRVPGLQAFVQVRGGGYFFLPGIRTLRFLCRPREG